MGFKPGLAFSPKTPTAAVTSYLSEINLVLPMSVEPGFGGQAFRHDTLAKIAELHQIIQKSKQPLDSSVERGCNDRNRTARNSSRHNDSRRRHRHLPQSPTRDRY